MNQSLRNAIVLALIAASLVLLSNCGIKAELKKIRQNAAPVLNDLAKTHFTIMKKKGFWLDEEAYQIYMTDSVMVTINAPGKRAYIDTTQNEMLLAYMIIGEVVRTKQANDLFLIKLPKTDTLTSMQKATLYNDDGEYAGDIDVSVTHLPGYDEAFPGDECPHRRGALNAVYYVDFEYYCIEVYPII